MYECEIDLWLRDEEDDSFEAPRPIWDIGRLNAQLLTMLQEGVRVVTVPDEHVDPAQVPPFTAVTELGEMDFISCGPPGRHDHPDGLPETGQELEPERAVRLIIGRDSLNLSIKWPTRRTGVHVPSDLAALATNWLERLRPCATCPLTSTVAPGVVDTARLLETALAGAAVLRDTTDGEPGVVIDIEPSLHVITAGLLANDLDLVARPRAARRRLIRSDVPAQVADVPAAVACIVAASDHARVWRIDEDRARRVRVPAPSDEVVVSDERSEFVQPFTDPSQVVLTAQVTQQLTRLTVQTPLDERTFHHVLSRAQARRIEQVVSGLQAAGYGQFAMAATTGRDLERPLGDDPVAEVIDLLGGVNVPDTAGRET